MRISDWSSDVCSSDLSYRRRARLVQGPQHFRDDHRARLGLADLGGSPVTHLDHRSFSLRVPLMRPDIRSPARSEVHTSELQSLMRLSYALFCLKKKYYLKIKYKRTTTQ